MWPTDCALTGPGHKTLGEAPIASGWISRLNLYETGGTGNEKAHHAGSEMYRHRGRSDVMGSRNRGGAS